MKVKRKDSSNGNLLSGILLGLLLLDLLAGAGDGDAQSLRAHGELAGLFDDGLVHGQRGTVDLDDIL